MFQAFSDHIDTHFPELRQGRFLLAFSGGVDSVVLMHLCKRAQLDFALGYCNFRLRGKESEAEEVFVRKLGENNKIETHITHFDTVGYVSKNKVSVQMAARELRYSWFNSLMKKHGFAVVVTAHHADDDLETFLINLSRGTGLAGLTGMPPKSRGLVRPLLEFSRAEILEYARVENLEWTEDSSNTDTKYLRNKIRHEVVPALKSLHPGMLSSFKTTRNQLAQSEALLQAVLEETKSNLFRESNDGTIEISLAELESLTPLNPYLFGLFQPFGFSQPEEIDSLMQAMSGKVLLSATHRLLKDRGRLILSPLPHSGLSPTLLELDEPGQWNATGFRLESVDALGELAPNILYVDKEKLNKTMELRGWEKADYFYPQGFNGHKKKVSKYFKDEKMDRFAKERQLLLCSGDDIVWVVGRRADERFKVTEATNSILKITWTG